MTSESYKAITGRFFEAFATNDQAVLNEVLAHDFVIHVPGAPAPVDRDTHVHGIGMFSMAFSDIRVVVEDQIAERDRVATRLTWQATHTGDFRGFAATGKQVSISAVDIARIKDDKIVERWFHMDQLGLMQQLGAVPPP